MATLEPNNKVKFINPYNFISKTSAVDRISKESDEVSGYINCVLTVKDALLLPDRSAPIVGKNWSYDFYRVEGSPVIPGSEIRGCIRSVYEAVTPSCFSVINTEILHQRISRPDAEVIPGILRKESDGNYYIYEAEKVNRNSAYDVERNWMNFKKHRMSVSYYVIISRNKTLCDKEQLKKLLFILDTHLENVADKDFKKAIEETKKSIEQGKPTVVFYDYNKSTKKMKYLSVAQVSRRVFDQTVPQMLGEHNKCSGKTGYCPACSLFGTIGDNSPVNSKLRFSDASACENVKIDELKIIPELSSPKITSLEFYSDRKDKSKIWTYDDEGVELRGRKFYFHSKPKTVSELNKRNMATRPAEAGSTFEFKVFFDKISEKQLKQLLWVLTIGDNDKNSSLMHKIGAGKPVGYGSVKITVDHIVLRKFDGKYQITKESFDSYGVNDSLFKEIEALAQFKMISNYDFVQGKTVSYPIADDGKNKSNSKAPHQWFLSNRPQNKSYRYTLPLLDPQQDSSSLELPAMMASYNAASYKASGTFANVSPEAQDKKTCPHCAKTNYKYRRDTKVENRNWGKGICFYCGEPLW